MAIKICKACKCEFDTRYPDLYCNSCKNPKKPNNSKNQGIQEKVYINCVKCDFRFLGWPQAKYCSNKCRPVNRYSLPSNRPRSIKNLKNTLVEDCSHFFPRNSHKQTEETMIFTCKECRGVMEIFKEPYNQEIPEKSETSSQL